MRVDIQVKQLCALRSWGVKLEVKAAALIWIDVIYIAFQATTFAEGEVTNNF